MMAKHQRMQQAQIEEEDDDDDDDEDGKGKICKEGSTGVSSNEGSEAIAEGMIWSS